MSDQELNITKLLETYQHVIDALMSCNKKQTVEHFLGSLDLEPSD